MQPENPDWHRETCFVLYKGMKSDDAMRTYVAAHIKLTWPLPHIEIKKSAGEVMETTSFVEPHDNETGETTDMTRVHAMHL